MAVNLVLADLLASKLEVLIDKKAKISRIANRDYEDMFKGKATNTVIIRRFSNVELLQGLAADAGSDIPETDLTVQSEEYELTQLNQLNVKVSDANRIINDFDQEDNVINRTALRTALNHDSFVASLIAQNAGTYLNRQSPATITKDNSEALYGSMQEALRDGDVEESRQAVFINSAVLNLSTQAPAYTGFDQSLKFKETFNIGSVATMAATWTNNLPVKYTFTFTVVATADNTITIRVPNAKLKSEGSATPYDEVVFTAKAAPSAAGEFDIAGTAAAQQVIITDMINGTGTPGASSYIELSAADRAVLRRGYLNCEDFADFAADKAGVTARFGTTILATLTTNTLSAKSNLIFALDPLAVHFGELMRKLKIVGTETNNVSFNDNIMLENVFGGKVTTENKPRIVVAEVTN